MRGEDKTVPVVARASSRSPWLYGALGVVVLAFAYFGYSFFSAPDKEPEKIASPAAPTTPTTEKKTDVQPSTAPMKPAATETKPIQEKANKPAVVMKQDSMTAAVKANEPPPTKAQEAAPAAPVKQEVAVAKEPTPAGVAAPLRLKMNIIGQRKESDGSYSEILVNEGSVLRSRDNFQVHLEASRPAYVYILLYDSQGKASQIFPDAKIDKPGFVDAGRKLVVPGRDLWFWLDESTGTETIYVLASDKPMTDIAGLLSKMEGDSDAGQKLASRQIKEKITVLQRGVGGITKGDAVTYTLSDGKKIQKVTDVVTGTGSVVRAVSFLHR